jgi:holin-like protein
MMRIIGQLTIIATVGFAGTFFAGLLPFPFPGSIMGMLLLFLLMTLRIVKTEHVRESAQFFLTYMAAFFIVPTVTLIEKVGMLDGRSLFHFIWICIASAFLTFLATAASVKLTLRLLHRSSGDKS